MSILYKEREVKEEPTKPAFKWSVKDILKNAVVAYKSFVNGGSTKQEFEQALIKQLYEPFKTTSETGHEDAEFEMKDAKNLALTKIEFNNYVKAISEPLRPLLDIKLFPNDHTDAKVFCRISFSLVQ